MTKAHTILGADHPLRETKYLLPIISNNYLITVRIRTQIPEKKLHSLTSPCAIELQRGTEPNLLLFAPHLSFRFAKTPLTNSNSWFSNNYFIGCGADDFCKHMGDEKFKIIINCNFIGGGKLLNRSSNSTYLFRREKSVLESWTCRDKMRHLKIILQIRSSSSCQYLRLYHKDREVKNAPDNFVLRRRKDAMRCQEWNVAVLSSASLEQHNNVLLWYVRQAEQDNEDN